jgi:excisionase family DNA binding protein
VLSIFFAKITYVDGDCMPIRDLAAHTARYVTVGELAEYWAVSRQQIYKRIGSGALESIRLGSRLYRVRTGAALEYERNATVTNGAPKDARARSRTNSFLDGHTLPQEIGLQRVPKKFGTK